VILLAVFVISMANSILYVALKTLAEAPPAGLGASESQLQWMVDAYTLAYAGLLLSAGVVGNRFGHKRLVLIGLVCFGGFSALSAFSHSPAELIACRGAMGFSAAFVMPATLAIVTNVFPGEARAKAIGIWSGVVGAAIAVGPIVAGVLLGHFWWGSMFLVNVPVVVVAVVIMSFQVPEFRQLNRRRFDPLGIALSAIGLLGVVYGVIRAGDLDRWTTPEVYLPVSVGLILLVGFAAWERRVDHPALDVRYFSNRGFTASVIALAVLFFALFGGTFVMTFYLQTIRGYSALHAGVCVLPLAGALIVFAPQAPALVRKFGARAVCSFGMPAAAAGLAGLATLHRGTAIWQFEIILFIFGTGMAHVLPPATAQIVGTVPGDEAGTSSAVNNAFRQVGGSIGIAVLGSLLASLYRGRIGPDLKVLPVGIRSRAGSSITTTLQAAQVAGGRALALVRPAEDAFMHAMRITWMVAAIVVFAGAIVVFLVIPGRRSD
jgi:EmrB/QacA subfamily drug resistance transporter